MQSAEQSKLVPAKAQDSLLTERQAAEMLQVKMNTLAVWRLTRRVPIPWIVLGSRTIRYRLSDILAYLESRQTGHQDLV